MSNKKLRIVMYGLAVLPLVVFLILYDKVPALIPGQWRLDGTVRYDSKNTFFLISGLWIFLAVLFDVSPNIDPRKKNYEKFKNYYDAFCIFLMIFCDIISAIVLIESFKPGTIAVSKVIIMLIGILFMFMGNIMPKFKSNFYIGIKTSWSLSDSDVWNKTNRLGGKLMFWSGLAFIFGAFLLGDKAMFTLLMVVVFVMAGVPVVMSYVWYRKKYKL